MLYGFLEYTEEVRTIQVIHCCRSLALRWIGYAQEMGFDPVYEECGKKEFITVIECKGSQIVAFNFVAYLMQEWIEKNSG